MSKRSGLLSKSFYVSELEICEQELEATQDVLEMLHQKSKKQLSTIRSMAAQMGARERKHAKELAAVNALKDALAFQLVAEQAKYGDLREDYTALQEATRYLKRDLKQERGRANSLQISWLILIGVVMWLSARILWGQS